MRKWSFLVAGLAWAVSMVYEWMWLGGGLTGYITSAVVGLTVMFGLFIKDSMRGGDGKEDQTPAMIWFLLAALVCAMLYAALGRAVEADPPRVQFLPMYLIMFLDFFLTGCIALWKKRSR